MNQSTNINTNQRSAECKRNDVAFVCRNNCQGEIEFFIWIHRGARACDLNAADCLVKAHGASFCS